MGRFACSRTRGRGEEVQLSSGWISIASELSSLDHNPVLETNNRFVIHYSNVDIKSLCSNLDIV